MQEVFNKYINYLEAERNASPYTIRNYTADLCGSKNIKGFFTFLVIASRRRGNPILRDCFGCLLRYLATPRNDERVCASQ